MKKYFILLLISLFLIPYLSFAVDAVDNNTINSNVSAPIETTTNVQPINTTNTAPIRIDKKTEYKNLLEKQKAEREAAKGKLQEQINARNKKIAECVSAAIEKRDYAILGSFDKKNTAVREAIVNRMSSQKEAQKIEDKKQRVTAMKNSWDNYKKSLNSALSNFRAEKKIIWDEYNKERKACGSNYYEDLGSSSADSSI